MPTKKPKNKSDFTDTVKEVVRNIPAGQTLSYKEVAILAKNPKAARAVARIMAANLDPEVPCHRVIRSDGSIGGYNRGGEEAKRVILESESNNK
jgi:O-6-methylguanine DNA methyltransferase